MINKKKEKHEKKLIETVDMRGPSTICLFGGWKSDDSEFLWHWTLQHVKISSTQDVIACKISVDVIPCRISAVLDAKAYKISAALDVKTCRISLHLGRQTLKNFCKVWNWKKKRLKTYWGLKSKTYRSIFFCWIMQNVALSKQHIFLIRENWSILLLLRMRNFCFVPKYCCFEANISLCLEKKNDILWNRYEKYL